MFNEIYNNQCYLPVALTPNLDLIWDSTVYNKHKIKEGSPVVMAKARAGGGTRGGFLVMSRSQAEVDHRLLREMEPSICQVRRASMPVGLEWRNGR